MHAEYVGEMNKHNKHMHTLQMYDKTCRYGAEMIF